MDKRIQIKDKIFSIYIPEDKIQKRIAGIAKEIARDHGVKDPLFICILNGSFMFASDLFKELNFPCQVSFIKFSSYEGGQSSGKIKELVGLKEDVENRHVIIVEDIIDTGLTIRYLLEELHTKKPLSVCVATLLLKKEALSIDIKPEYVGFEVPDKFLVGYGLDYDGHGRNQRHIYAEIEK